MGKWVNLYDLAIWIPLQPHLCWLYHDSKTMPTLRKGSSLICVEFHFMSMAWFVWINLYTDLQPGFSAWRLLSSETSEGGQHVPKKGFCLRLWRDVLKFWHFWGLNVLKLGFGFICSHHLCWSYKNTPPQLQPAFGFHITVECDSLRHLSIKETCPRTAF